MKRLQQHINSAKPPVGRLRGLHHHQPRTFHTTATSISTTTSIFDLAQHYDDGSITNGSTKDDPLARIFSFTCGIAHAGVGPDLAAKYGGSLAAQRVASVTNRVTGEQAWFNAARSSKPQTFAASSTSHDPTNGGGPGRCDFCDWPRLTAGDAGDAAARYEAPLAVTASNLFKYGEPAHGLAIIKEHGDPLRPSRAALADLLEVSQAWFDARPGLSPFFLWNALARAGASQYHPHAQLLATRVPVPAQARLDAAGPAYERMLLDAHAAAGLARSVGGGVWVAASLSPIKDCELLVFADGAGAPDGAYGLASRSFGDGLHVALRALVDGLGAQAFNVGVMNVPVMMGRGRREHGRWMLARVVARGGGAASDFGALEVIGGASIGKTDPYTVITALDEVLVGVKTSQ